MIAISKAKTTTNNNNNNSSDRDNNNKYASQVPNYEEDLENFLKQVNRGDYENVSEAVKVSHTSRHCHYNCYCPVAITCHISIHLSAARIMFFFNHDTHGW